MSAIINRSIGETLETLLDDAIADALIVDPSAAVIEALVEVGTETDTTTATKILATDTALKDIADDFLIASNAADLIAADRMALRTHDRLQPGNELVITDQRLTALVAAGDRYAALSTEDSGFVDASNEFYGDLWADADPFSLRTPPLSQVRETLRSDISPQAEADFNAVLASLETARGAGDGLDEVTISLLVAAKNEELLYDISKWGEDIGIASKATFSRTKTMLEDLGLIDTEKVPIDVGRPRLRLKFAEERLQSATADELASLAQTLMH